MTSAHFEKTHHRLALYPTPPFNFEKTVFKPSHFPSTESVYQEGTYWQTMRFTGAALGIRMIDKGTTDDPRVDISIFGPKEIGSQLFKKIAAELEYRFDMRTNMNEFYQDCRKDRLLRPVLARQRGMRVSTNVSLYEFLVIATVLQNATVRRSAQMLDNLFEEYGSKVAFNRRTLSLFWPPETICRASEQDLRSLKLGYRAKTLKRQAEPFASGEIDEFSLRALPTDELKKVLLQIYGVGPASVWYLLFEVFKRYEAFEHISPWEQKIFSRLLFNKELVDERIILDEVEARWGKWKMLAAHYLFEDLFWQNRTRKIPWLDELIRL